MLLLHPLSSLHSGEHCSESERTFLYFSFFHFQALTVSVNGETVGTVRERATWWNPVYHVFDSVGNQVLKIRGPWCHFALCDDVIFNVLDTDGSSLASIAKKWKGCLRETLTDADNFEITFNDGLSTDTKVLILGATFLIDMMYFEMSS